MNIPQEDVCVRGGHGAADQVGGDPEGLGPDRRRVLRLRDQLDPLPEGNLSSRLVPEYILKLRNQGQKPRVLQFWLKYSITLHLSGQNPSRGSKSTG